MKKLKKILVEVSSKKFLAVIFSMLFVSSIAGPVFAAATNSFSGGTVSESFLGTQVDNSNSADNSSQITLKLGENKVIGAEGDNYVRVNASVNGVDTEVLIDRKDLRDICLKNQGNQNFSVSIEFNSDKAEITGVVNGKYVISAENIKSISIVGAENVGSTGNSDNNDNEISSASQSNLAGNAVNAQSLTNTAQKTTVIKKGKLKNQRAKKTNKSKKKANKAKKKANKANKAVKKTTNKTWTDKKGNVHSSKITTTRIKNKKGKVVKTIVNATTTVKDSNGKTISTTTRKSTIKRNKNGGFTSTTHSVKKDADGKVIQKVDQTLNVDKKGNVTGTKTVTDKDGNKVTYDVTGTRKVSIDDKTGNKTVTYNLTLKDQKTGETINVKTENVYDKNLNCTSHKKWENGNLTRVEANGVLQFTRDSKGNANFYKNGVFDHAVSADQFKGLTKSQRNQVIQKEIANPGTANKNIQKFQNQNQQKKEIWNSFAKKKIDNYTYDTVKKGSHKGQVKLTVTGANGYKFVVYVKNDKEAIKLGDKIMAAKSTSALQGLLKNHKVNFYKSGKRVATSRKGHRGMDLLF